MTFKLGVHPQSRYQITGARLGQSSFFDGRLQLTVPRARIVRGRRSVQAKAKPDGEEPISPPLGPPFAGLFGGTKKIKPDKLPAFQAPGVSSQQLKKGTQQLKKGTEQQLKKGTQQLKKGTQRLKLGGRGVGGLPLPGTGTKPIGSLLRRAGRKDPNTVFVAGATGRLGARVVRELLEASPQLRLRVGVRKPEAAAQYLQTAVAYGLLPADAARRVQLVAADVTQPETLPAAIGSASKVVQAIGAPESEALNFGNPKKIDGDGSIALVEAAVQLEVDQFVMVTSLGTAKFGWPAAILNLFGGILTQKRRAEVALQQSGLNYVIVRPGGMERPTDAYKRTHNVTLALQDTLFGGQVSRLQVAELIASIVANPDLAENKVLEVVAETTAPLRPYEKLLGDIPSDISQADKLAKRQAQQERAEVLEAARARLEEASAAAAKANNTVREFSAQAGEARKQAASAAKEAGPAVSQAKSAEQQLGRLREALQAAQQKEAAAKAVLAAATQAARQGRLLSDEERAEAEAPILAPERYAQEQERKAAAAEQAKQKEQAAAQQRAQKEAAAAADEKSKRDAAAKAQAKRKQDTEAKAAKAPAVQEDPEAARKRREADAKARAEIEARAVQAAADERAKREADSKAKREAEANARRATENKVKEAAAAEARKKAEAKAMQEAEAKAKQDAEAKGKAEAEAKAKQEAEAKAKSEQVAVAPAAAKANNAEEARQWISNWRSGSKGGTVQQEGTSPPPGAASRTGSSSSSSSSSEGQPGNVFAGLKLPWQQQRPSENGSAGNGEPKEPAEAVATGNDTLGNVLEAREWIRAWRARNLEKSLPRDVQARG